ncbi:hypothetical protein SPRG_16837, partial [Saprolegnia parasitica CBS 223.65]
MQRTRPRRITPLGIPLLKAHVGSWSLAGGLHEVVALAQPTAPQVHLVAAV